MSSKFLRWHKYEVNFGGVEYRTALVNIVINQVLRIRICVGIRIILRGPDPRPNLTFLI
jgi:hypothetical protein